MVTEWVGLWWVSPCTQLMGITTLPSSLAGAMSGQARLTGLPESNNAFTGCPSILTFLSGAPESISRCTIQPAVHARIAGGLGSVGIGSSRGSLVTGLLAGLELAVCHSVLSEKILLQLSLKRHVLEQPPPTLLLAPIRPVTQDFASPQPSGVLGVENEAACLSLPSLRLAVLKAGQRVAIDGPT